LFQVVLFIMSSRSCFILLTLLNVFLLFFSLLLCSIHFCTHQNNHNNDVFLNLFLSQIWISCIPFKLFLGFPWVMCSYWQFVYCFFSFLFSVNYHSQWQDLSNLLVISQTRNISGNWLLESRTNGMWLKMGKSIWRWSLLTLRSIFLNYLCYCYGQSF
jgi:hypothetical protein